MERQSWARELIAGKFQHDPHKAQCTQRCKDGQRPITYRVGERQESYKASEFALSDAFRHGVFPNQIRHAQRRLARCALSSFQSPAWPIHPSSPRALTLGPVQSTSLNLRGRRLRSLVTNGYELLAHDRARIQALEKHIVRRGGGSATGVSFPVIWHGPPVWATWALPTDCRQHSYWVKRETRPICNSAAFLLHFRSTCFITLPLAVLGNSPSTPSSPMNHTHTGAFCIGLGLNVIHGYKQDNSPGGSSCSWHGCEPLPERCGCLVHGQSMPQQLPHIVHMALRLLQPREWHGVRSLHSLSALGINSLNETPSESVL